MCYTFSSIKSYDMHWVVHDWLVNGAEMVIYAFLQMFKSDSQRHMILRSRQSDQKLYTSFLHNMHYKTQTSKV